MEGLRCPCRASKRAFATHDCIHRTPPSLICWGILDAVPKNITSFVASGLVFRISYAHELE